MKQSLRTKLSLSYILVAVFLVAIITLFTNFLLEKQFKEYVIQQQEQRNNDTVNLIARQYNGAWSKVGIENIGVSALEEGMIVKVRDNSGNVIWDATVHNNGMCTSMLEHMAKNMENYNVNFKGGYIETNYPVILNLVQVGSVDIGHYGPYYFTDNDLVFINTLNKLFIGVGIASLLLALVVGALMAKLIHISLQLREIIISRSWREIK